MSLVALGLVSEQVMREHRATWFVYAGEQKIRHAATMRGTWGYDVECSCGEKSTTGGGTKGYVQNWLDNHRIDATQEG